MQCNIDATKSCNNQDKVTKNREFPFSTTGINIASLNINHIIPKLDEIKFHLSQTIKPHIFGLCETFLHSDIENKRLQLENYSIERKDRMNKHGGGIIVYISEKLSYTRRFDLEVNDIESICLQVNHSKKDRFLICFVYRPPSSNQTWIDMYESQMKLIDKTNLHFYMLGDYNFQYIPGNSNRSFTNTKWNNLVSTFGLHQLIQEPTRVSKTSSTIIDHIYTNCIDFVNESFVSCLSLSDHFPVCFTYHKHGTVPRYNDVNHKTITYRSFKNFDEVLFQKHIACTNSFFEMETITDPNIALNTFCNLICGILNKHAPIKEKRIKRDQQPGWFTQELQSLIYKRDACHKKGNIDEYKELKNRIASLIKSNKKEFLNQAISENIESKHLWRHLKDISGIKQNSKIVLPQHIIKENTCIEDEQSIINELNHHFINISNIITKTKFTTQNFCKLEHKLNEQLRYHTFDIQPITALDVKHLIDKLNVNKSTGVDGIGPKILKYCGDLITPCIASIINNSINSGIFPDILKCAKVIPLYKSGDKNDPGNYRPISILPTISKIYERHIASQLRSYLSKTKVLQVSQSGFRKNHSCNTALIKLTDTWLKQIDQGNMVGTVFLDLKKAFDLVDHEILLHKLKLHHFSDKSISLFTSYLSNRQQSIKVGKITSSSLCISSGVPQGSILGPILFLIYINDITIDNPEMNIDLFADDSTMHESSNNVHDIQIKLQQNINCITKWCKTNNMALNPTKSTCMLIGSSYRLKINNALKLTINNQILVNVTLQKILGVYVDNTLNWKAQIDSVCKRLNNKISLLKGVLYYLNDDMKMMFYNAYILPIMDYCCVVWGQNGHYKNKISKIQRRIARIILNKPNRSPSTNLLDGLNWMSFENRCKYHTALLVFKTMNNDSPEYMHDILKFSQNSTHHLRSETNKNLTLRAKPRTNYYKQSFSYNSFIVWNDIPMLIKTSRSVNSFKSRCKDFLQQQH